MESWSIAHLVSSANITIEGNLKSLTTMTDFEVEQDEMSRANPPVDLTPDLWVRADVTDRNQLGLTKIF